MDGATNTLWQVIHFLREHGVGLSVFSPSETKGLKVPGYPEIRTAFVPWSMWDEELAAYPGPDIYHAFAPAFIGLIGLEELHLSNHNPSVASFNTVIPEYLKYYHLDFLSKFFWPYYCYIHNQADLNLAPSKSVAVEMKKHNIKNVAVWGRGVDSKLFCPDSYSTDLRRHLTDGHEEKPIVLYVGRLAREKNLEAFLPLIQAYPEAQFVFVGSGPSAKDLKSLFQYSHVKFIGPVPHADLPAYYASSDIFITLSCTEGCPNTVLEAAASGLPVIGLSALGVGDMLHESRAGLSANPCSPEKLKNAVGQLLQDKYLRQQLGANGRDFALSHTWRSCLWELMGYYKQAINIKNSLF
jgi:glycosyltransferase involved in cell wall biosynthesis